jgi:cellulose synthase/poly-beta-1,6-N-acetylglucosamine synthase-like glycosyltransferase
VLSPREEGASPLIEPQLAYSTYSRERRRRVAAVARRVTRPAVRPPRELPSISVVVPAHNEEGTIAAVLASLRWQTLAPTAIYVIADNCTDGTAELAARDDGVQVFHTTGNQHKKAGALNQLLERILPAMAGDEMILVQDADTFLDPSFLEVTSAKIRDGYAAVGGNFRGRSGGGICGALQRNEYVRYARDVGRKRGKVLCVTGVGTVFSVRALKDVAAAYKDGRLPSPAGGYVYSYATLTEDNFMTLALKSLGHKVLAPEDAIMTTEVMLTWRQLGRQRLRWKRGAIEDLVSFGLSRATISGWARQLVSVLGIMATVIYVLSLLIAPWIGVRLQPLWLGITVLYALERAITVRERGWRVSLLSATVLCEWAYDMFLQAVHVRALTGAVFRTRREW